MHKKYASLLFIGIAAMSNIVSAQKKEDKDTITKLNDIVVYANKFPEKAGKIAQTISVIRDRNAIQLQANTGDVLLNSGQVFVQKSQQGGSSPVIRGFEASRILLNVDGIRLNNAIYRSGHLQNIITIDNMVLDRVEIIYGPSSTLYGSDALGGAVNMITKDPVLSASKKTVLSGSSTLRYASATDEQRANVLLNIGGSKWASLTAFTAGSFGDMTQGNNRKSAYPEFGKKNFIVTRENNTDIASVNPNPNKQVASGYNQYDILQKIMFTPDEKSKHVLNIQLSNSSDVPRYDRLSEISGGKPVFAEWYYGPQVRNLVGYHYTASKLNGFFQDVKVTASYQNIEESRITRRFQNNNKDFRWEKVNVFGINIDAKHSSGNHELHIGAESYQNFVRSTAERKNIVTSVLSAITTRYADGPTTMQSNALYAQHTYKISKQLTLNDGIRLNLTKLDARFADTTLMHFPFNKVVQQHLAATGNIGLAYAVDNTTKIGLIVSSGFRAPNVDDLSKVFDTKTGSVVVPNANLKPEYTYNAELNFNHTSGTVSFGGSIFYTQFKQALVVDRFTFNGQDSIFYSGVKSAVFATQNKARAYVFGWSANATIKFTKQLILEGVATYTTGKYTDHKAVQVPLDHIPPFFGKVSIKQSATIWNASIFGQFNGWKKIKDYNPNGEDNQQYATPEGMPSWFTLNAKFELNMGKAWQTQISLENIFDANYRYFASGISAPGRNLSIALRKSF
jgi:hemoglobin/transferrin/lactoferrin receptor protein